MAKENRIGVMSQTRGTMPPPTRAKQSKKGKGSYNRKQGKRVEY
ncbi:hypothetical protein Q9R38_26125 [Priestia aryabhattai]|nr:hypothetical protein [Priestia aryabhattai]MDT0150022.1 hypothetical protein [Priestia aryabhattai]MDT0155592.1 hypothetical protein [Priestia aryabhattai]